MFQESLKAAYEGKRVWISGHTGFKGSWLCELLLGLGAKVYGYSLPAPTEPNLFSQLGLASRLSRHEIGDVREPNKVSASILAAAPDYVFHLAAQPLVRLSYAKPVETFSTNVMGTIHVMEALRGISSPCAAVVVTTDKCYLNQEWMHGYRESDPLGGHDPYSASKAACELAVATYRNSFFGQTNGKPSAVVIASARAGNVIGGGDWALDRIVPDCMRALGAKKPIFLRNPHATRPWQHVLEPLGGYLLLAARLREAKVAEDRVIDQLASAFNFGPDVDSNRDVLSLTKAILKHWEGSYEVAESLPTLHEAGKLHLTTEKAFHLLGWRPTWSFQQTMERTTFWYRQAHVSPADIPALTRQDIQVFFDASPNSCK